MTVGLFLSGGSLALIYTGLAVTGICVGASVVPMIPEIITVMNEELTNNLQA